MAKNNDILNFTYSIFPADWRQFRNRAKKHPNIGFGQNEKDDAGEFDFAYLKKEKVFLAKFYKEEMEIVTDITKTNFFKYMRGADIDIYTSVMESIHTRLSYVLTDKSVYGLQEPVMVLKGLKVAENALKDYPNGQIVLLENYESFVSKNMSIQNMNRLEVVKILVESNDIIFENKIESDADFTKYANDRLKKKFGDKFDQEIADKVIKGLKDKYKDNYGAAVGALR